MIIKGEESEWLLWGWVIGEINQAHKIKEDKIDTKLLAEQLARMYVAVQVYNTYGKVDTHKS